MLDLHKSNMKNCPGFVEAREDFGSNWGGENSQVTKLPSAPSPQLPRFRKTQVASIDNPTSVFHVTRASPKEGQSYEDDDWCW
ncbi:hypothetical protein P8452_65422 [Trifolium repens]|nr:hypothetical protein P8452_65422 [Trifolium repens]